MTARNAELWYKHFKDLEEYVAEFNKLPNSNTVYKDFKLGEWLKNQRFCMRKGTLPEEYIQSLNNLFPSWCSSRQEITESNKKQMINSDWKSKVPEGHTSIDAVFKGDKLYDYLSREIFDIETLLESKNNLNIHLYYECISKVIPFIDTKYAVLLRVIFGEAVVAPLNNIKEFFYSFCVSSADEMKDKMNKMLDALNDSERLVINLRFALTEDTDHMMTLSEVAKVRGVTNARIRQIEAKAIRKLRHPVRVKIIRNAGNFLDDYLFNQKTRATLYRMGINSKDEIINLIKEDNISSELKINLEDFIKNDEEREKKKLTQIQVDDILKKPIFDINLSTRAYNALKRAGIYTVKDLVKLVNDNESLMKVRNLGKISVDEVKHKLDELGVLGLEIQEDEEPEAEKPTRNKILNVTKPNAYKLDNEFDMEAVNKELGIKRRINEVINKLKEILDSNDKQNIIPSLEEDCNFIFFNSKNANEDIGLSNLITCVMLLVRVPSVLSYKEFVKWLKYAIGIYQYLNNYELTYPIIDGELFNLRAAINTSIYCEYTKNIFIDEVSMKEIVEKIKNHQYDNNYLFNLNSNGLRSYRVCFGIKALHHVDKFHLYAYDVSKFTRISSLKKQFPNIPNIQKLLENMSLSLTENLQFIDEVKQHYNGRVSDSIVNELENKLYEIVLTIGPRPVEQLYREIERNHLDLPLVCKSMVLKYNDNKIKIDKTFITGDKVRLEQMNLIVSHVKDQKTITCINPFDTNGTRFAVINVSKEQLKKGWI